jgi:hypothetical protein
MGHSKDYNEVIFAGKQADEARCGWMRLKEKTTEVQGPRIPPIYLAVVCRRRPSTHPTLHPGRDESELPSSISAKKLGTRTSSAYLIIQPNWVPFRMASPI